MARIQILELPLDTSTENATTPFVLVFDQAEDVDVTLAEAFRKSTGAKAAFVYDGVLEIPANSYSETFVPVTYERTNE